MRFLLDEMLPPATCEHLRDLGHEAVHVQDVRLRSRPDSAIAAAARREGFVLVTENVRDFAAERGVVIACVLRDKLPRQGMEVYLAERLDEWARSCPDPYPGLHWP